MPHLQDVASVLLNPQPASTFADPLDLRACDGATVPNEACVRNDIELQNYVLQLQLPFADAGVGSNPLDEAIWARQVQRGSRVLALSDYLIFSPS